MMVVVEPKDQLAKFSASVGVSALGETEVRLGPGKNYAVIATVEEGTAGQVVDHSNQLNGVRATGSYWWKVQFGDIVGWVADESLAGSGP